MTEQDRKDRELPLGFGMALAQNETAMRKFEALSAEKKQSILEKTHSVRSKQEMQQLVSELTNWSM